MPRRHLRAFARLESMRVLNRASALALLAALALLTAAVVPAEPRDVPAPAPETHAPPTEPVAPEPPPAPAAAPPDMFLDEHGKPLPFVEAVRSGRSTGVPGAIAMLYAAHSKLGRLRWKELFQPAIRAATAGFKVPARLASFLGEGSPFPPTNEVRMMFARPDGETVQEGDLFRNPKYAHTLERIARQGPRALYEGEIAREIVATTHLPALPGTMTLKDLASYRASWTEPVCRPYRGYPVCVPPPPSSGVSLLQMLSILDRTDIGGRPPSGP